MLYKQLRHNEFHELWNALCMNNGTPMLVSAYYPNLSCDTMNGQAKVEYQFVTMDCLGGLNMWEPRKSGHTCHSLDWNRDSENLIIFNRVHLEYQRLITMREGQELIVANLKKEVAYKAQFVKYEMRGNAHYVRVKKAGTAEEEDLHCYSYEVNWICFPAE